MEVDRSRSVHFRELLQTSTFTKSHDVQENLHRDGSVSYTLSFTATCASKKGAGQRYRGSANKKLLSSGAGIFGGGPEVYMHVVQGSVRGTKGAFMSTYILHEVPSGN